MPSPITDLKQLLQSMTPVMNAGAYVFATVDNFQGLDLGKVVACMREPEGLSVVLAEAEADRLGLPAPTRFAWITLQVHSDLQAVGLTAAFAAALGREGVSCNVVAGHHHDHIFVPLDQAGAAMTALQSLQQSALAKG